MPPRSSWRARPSSWSSAAPRSSDCSPGGCSRADDVMEWFWLLFLHVSALAFLIAALLQYLDGRQHQHHQELLAVLTQSATGCRDGQT